MQRRHLFLAGFALSALGPAALAHDYQVGGISIGHPYARATLPGQRTGGAYLRLENRGGADRLVAVRAGVSAGVELHDMRMEGDVMRMREVDAIEVPSNQAVVLQPGGLHIMLVGLKAPLKEGDRFAMTLRFAQAGEVTVEVAVEAVKAAGPMKHGMKHAD